MTNNGCTMQQVKIVLNENCALYTNFHFYVPGLIPHCLAVLRTCHSLTERLADFAMRPMSMKGSPERLVEAAKRIPFRVDDVGKYIYKCKTYKCVLLLGVHETKTSTSNFSS